MKRILPPFEEASSFERKKNVYKYINLYKSLLQSKAGYNIALVLIDNSPAVAVARSMGRFLKGGRYASEEYIEASL